MAATDDERVAYNEAGHAVAACLLEIPFARVSIEPNAESLGRVILGKFADEFRPDYEHDPRTLHRARCYIMTAVAGLQAEVLFAGRKDDAGASADYEAAIGMASRLVGSFEEALELGDEAVTEIRELLSTPPHRRAVRALALALLDQKTLDAETMRRIVQNALNTDSE